MLASARLVGRVPLKHVARAASTFPPKTGSSSKPPLLADATTVDPVLFLQLRQRIIERHNPSGVEPDDPHVQLVNKNIFNIKRGLDKHDVALIRESWRELKAASHLHILTREVVEQIARLATASLLPNNSSTDEWDSDRQSFVEEVALAAASHSTDALNASLVAYLNRGDSRAVLELYEKFKRVAEDLPQSQTSYLTHTEDDIAVVAPTTIPGRANLVLAVVAAYAMEDCFQGALQECINMDINFRRFPTEEISRTISFDHTLRKTVYDFIHRIALAKSVARPHSFSKHIHNLATNQSTLLEDTYNSILEAITQPDAYIAADATLVTPTKSVAMTELIWASFLIAFLKRDRKDMAAKLWNDMTQFGMKPGILTWNMVLDMYSSRGTSKDVLGAWDTMSAHGIVPDGSSYRALISSLCSEQRWDDALRWFQKFGAEVLPTAPVAQALMVHNAMLHGFLNTGRENAKTAFALFEKMVAEGPKPDLVSYNTLMSHHGRHSDFKGMASVINQMTTSGVSGDVFTFSTILSALLKVGRTDAPDMVLSIMRKQGIRATVATYSTIIDSQMREQTIPHLEAAMRLLDEMEKEPSVTPNEVTYTSILAALYRGSWLSDDQVEAHAQDIVARMKKRNIKLKPGGYHILIKACVAFEGPARVDKALELYREMVRDNIPRVDDTWYVLLAGLSSHGEWHVANEIVNEMYASGAEPGGSLLRLANKIRREVRM
ncbi:hypothetical protein B0H15DRAFT_813023 [Mycena belliarum]|uniref:Pentatricopeptide repeat-containing protein n=1 Tax=Mycena belliarum TaxID=1033014 RepID=A0AAD6UPU0_9AGAR|nr:hypothetical protein B0H15DRAFT_813023 [Mycena belliae]